jgi:uncharacterized membrane protein
MEQFFKNYSTIIIFLHVFSAVIWVGGMIAIRVAVHPVMQSISEPKIKFQKTIEIVGKLFNLVLPFILILLVTAIILILSLNLKGALIYAKEAIWSIMFINYIFMFYKRAKAHKLFNNQNFQAAKEEVKLLPTVLLPINIFLGVVAIFLGVILRGY